jgi:hypothetical protein
MNICFYLCSPVNKKLAKRPVRKAGSGPTLIACKQNPMQTAQEIIAAKAQRIEEKKGKRISGLRQVNLLASRQTMNP